MVRYYGGVAYAGAEGSSSTGGGVLVDPARPNAAGWQWLTTGSGGPYGGRSYTGGGAIGRPAAGGITVLADADSAATIIDCWWSGAPYLRLVRIVNGERNPVRNGFPIVTQTATRTNDCTNPSGEVSTDGYLGDANTTVTNPTSVNATQGSRVIRLTATAAGTVSTTVPCLLDPLNPTPVSMDVRVSAVPSGALTVTAQWIDSTGASLPSSTATVASLTGYTTTAPVTRTPILTITPPSGASEGALSLSVAGMAVGDTVDLDGVLIGDAGEYFDGDALHGSWMLAPHLSASQLAGAQQIVDREVPLDVPVTYEMSAPDQPGYQVLSQPVTVESKRRVWLSHPTLGLPMEVNVEAEPEQTFAIEQGVHNVVGRKRPVVVSAAVRRAATGTYTIATRYFADRDQLLSMLSDGSPLLLRMPADHGHGPGEWLAIADVKTSVNGHMAREGTRHFDMPFTVVDPPALPDIG